MKNKQLWTETKFIKTKQGYILSKDRNHLSVGFRFVAGIQIKIYSAPRLRI